jgi:hypothetical protein
LELLAAMAHYYYDISGDSPYLDVGGTAHSSDSAAWHDAVRLVRDIEEHLRPDGGKWGLTVREDGRIVYRIEVTARIGGKRH